MSIQVTPKDFDVQSMHLLSYERTKEYADVAQSRKKLSQQHKGTCLNLSRLPNLWEKLGLEGLIRAILHIFHNLLDKGVMG